LPPKPPDGSADLSDAAIFAASPCGLVVANAGWRILRANAMFRSWAGIGDQQDITGELLPSFFDVASRIYFETHVVPLLLTQLSIEELAIDLTGPGGEAVSIILNVRLVTGVGEQPDIIYCAFLKATERRRHERELLLARRRVEEALAAASQSAAAMTRFADFASHDLEAPLRKIRLHVDLLGRALDSGNDDDRDHCMDVLKRSARQGSDLVSSLLHYARTGNSPLAMTMTRLDRLIEDVLADSIEQDQMSEAVVVMDLPPVSVECDPQLIRQVFRNLIGNALKYRKPDQPARLTISYEERPAHNLRVIHLADQGIGFRQEDAGNIFEPLRRLVPEAAYPGSGIGLALVDTVVRRHGWSITACGEPDAGATFSLAFPILPTLD
jgi:signal transduction histidine kinase